MLLKIPPESWFIIITIATAADKLGKSEKCMNSLHVLFKHCGVAIFHSQEAILAYSREIVHWLFAC
jgi:hypothetical protein